MIEIVHREEDIILQGLKKTDIVAIDFETKGVDFSHPEFKAVGVGISYHSKSVYIDFSRMTKDQVVSFLLFIGEYKLIGHNLMFDAGVYYRIVGKHANWNYCTFGLYKQLSGEGFFGQKWGLKSAQKDMLGWKETNEKELDQWLVDNNYVRGNGWKADKDQGSKRYKSNIDNKYHLPDKGEMWRAPADILGHYCCLDADSTWQLYMHVLRPVITRFPMFDRYHQRDFLGLVTTLVEQQMSGITMDRDELSIYNSELKEKIEETKLSFYDTLKEYMDEYQSNILKESKDKEPARYLKIKYPKEPIKLRKDGSISKSWLNWEAKMEEINSTPPTESKNWIAWKAKYELLSSTYQFNLNSNEQLKWLFYDKLGFEPRAFSPSGEPAVNKDVYKYLGAGGRVLDKYNKLVKEEGYIQSCLENIRKDDNGYYRLHPQFRCPGTLTGRLAGTGGVNVQQIPKTVGYLSTWRPLSNNIQWLDNDHSALEPVVLTELSEDRGLWNIYGPKAKPNDIYIYFGYNVKEFGDKFKAEGYDPNDPTPESISSIKKKYKKERGICKTVHLAKQYGAGFRKIHQTLTTQGIEITEWDAKAISDTWDRTFSGIKDYHFRLVNEWKRNGGWVYNGVGRPIAVAEDYIKDIVNRVGQSTGHDIHMMYVGIVTQLAKQRNIPFKWIIADFHDQSIVECEKQYKEELYRIIGIDAYDILNKELGGKIPIKGDPQYIECMAQAKCEDYIPKGK